MPPKCAVKPTSVTSPNKRRKKDNEYSNNIHTTKERNRRNNLEGEELVLTRDKNIINKFILKYWTKYVKDHINEIDAANKKNKESIIKNLK